MTPESAGGDVWSEQKQIAETAVRLYRRMGIDHPESLIGQSLGHAEAAANEAVRLFLVGLDSDALWFLEAAKRLAKSAFEHDEKYVYRDIDGRNSFAKFIATRIVAEAEWLQGETCAGESQRIALNYLLDVYTYVRHDAASEAADPKLTARMALHLAESSRWGEILDLPGKPSARSAWTALFSALRSGAANVMNGDPNAARDAVDRWFSAYVSNPELRRPISAELTFIEALVAARVRASLGKGAEPANIVKSIRWPELT